MYKSARIKLTVFYSIIFIGVLWLFSAGIYVWMDRSYGEGYISRVKNQQIEQTGDEVFDTKSNKIVTIAGDIALGELRRVLTALDLGFLVIIPVAAWFLTGKTLKPLEQSYEKQKQFVSDASHELRTPLTIMQGELDVALKGARSPKQYQQAMRSTREEVVRLRGLSEALLMIARGDQGMAQSPREPVDITDVLTEAIAQFEKMAAAKPIALSFRPPALSMVVLGQAEALRQLFTNLIDNAVKYTPEHGSVEIILHASKGMVVIDISDTGVGMDTSAAKHAFERFYRGEAARSEAGFGLGLAICDSIVKQHHGTISLSSKIGEGTTVTTTLPMGAP
jgi:signal transduction histidine kinase